MLRLTIAAAALLLAGTASAQTRTPVETPPAHAPAGKLPMPAADPGQTTATYDDWVLRCVRGADGKGRTCELVQTMVLQGQQQPVAQIALGYDKNDLRLTLLVPPAISFSKTPLLGVSTSPSPNYTLAWRRCLPSGCFADVQVGPELLKVLRSRNDPMQISFKDAGERDAVLPVSFRGLVAALDALAKEPR